MRRRRSRLPLILLGGLALLFGAGLGVVASGLQPNADLLGWFAAHPAPASPASTATDSATASTPGPSDGAGASGNPPATAESSGGQGRPGGPSGAPGSAQPSGSTASSPASSVEPSTSPGATSGPTSSPQTSTGGMARAVYNGSRAKKAVALTFDDGYNPVALRQILAILKREKITATFFPYGWAVHKDPAGWHMVVAAGYPIGNHTQSHATLTNLTPDEVTSEMTRGHATVDLYSGGKSVMLMRPPGGAFNAPTARAIAKAGYQTIVMWDVDTFDWQGPSAATILARATRGTNGSIVLMHSGPANTPKALPAIIANYRARGFTFVTIPELLAER